MKDYLKTVSVPVSFLVLAIFMANCSPSQSSSLMSAEGENSGATDAAAADQAECSESTSEAEDQQTEGAYPVSLPSRQPSEQQGEGASSHQDETTKADGSTSSTAMVFVATFPAKAADSESSADSKEKAESEKESKQKEQETAESEEKEKEKDAADSEEKEQAGTGTEEKPSESEADTNSTADEASKPEEKDDIPGKKEQEEKKSGVCVPKTKVTSTPVEDKK